MDTSRDLNARRKAAVPRGVGMFAGAVTAASATGASLTDAEGKEWIDLSGGIGVVNAGHCPPSVVKAIQEQAAKLLHICIHVATYEPYLELCEKLNELLSHQCGGHLNGRAAAWPNRSALTQSPNEAFAARHGARIRGVNSLPSAYALLERREVDAIVFDRPQLQYFMRQQSPAGSAISPADYGQQDYGFALATSSRLQRDLDLNLLQLRESGGLARIVGQWLGGE